MDGRGGMGRGLRLRRRKEGGLHCMGIDRRPRLHCALAPSRRGRRILNTLT